MKVTKLSKVSAFTLIELLIVIAVIGILATAVLSAINPIEQIKKGRDAARKSDAAEFLNALERYFTTFELYPWSATGVPAAGTLPDYISVAVMTNDTANGSFQELLNKNELKPQYENRLYLDELFVTEEAANNLVHVCFIPESATQREKAKVNKVNGSGSAVAACEEDADIGFGVTACHICLPE